MRSRCILLAGCVVYVVLRVWRRGRASVAVNGARFLTCAVLCSIGPNVKLLLDRPDGTYCFRLHEDRVYYVR